MLGAPTPSFEKPGTLTRVGEVPVFYYRTFWDQATQTENLLLAQDLRFAAGIASALRERGALALAVGGYVRDLALARITGQTQEPNDIDIEVHGIRLADLCEFLKTYGPAKPAGTSFDIAQVINPTSGSILHFSVPHYEVMPGPEARAFDATTDPSTLVFEAGRRRDLTINTLALDPLTGQVIDSFGGLDDLRHSILRAADLGRFGQDPAQALRIMQFAGRFNFTVDPATAELCRNLDLTSLSSERIGGEWIKLLTKSERPSVGLEIARRLGILGQLHPELAVLDTINQDPAWHPEGNVWEHTKLVVDAAAQIAREEGLSADESLVVLFGALCHDLGKATATQLGEKDGGLKITAHGHPAAGVEPARHFLKELHIKNSIIDQVLRIIYEHHFHYDNPDPTDKQVRKLAQRLAPANIRLWDLVCRSDANGRGREYQTSTASYVYYEKSQMLEVADGPVDPLIKGKDLIAEFGLSQGPHFKVILDLLYEAQLNEGFTTVEGVIAYYRWNEAAIQTAIDEDAAARAETAKERSMSRGSLAIATRLDAVPVSIASAEAGEQPGVGFYVERTIDLLCTPEFRARFIANQTVDENAILEAVRRSLPITANKRAKDRIKELAAERLGLDIASAGRLGREWHNTVRDISWATSEATGSLPLKDYLLGRQLILIAESEDYTSQFVTAEQSLNEAAQAFEEQLDDLLDELSARRGNADLLQAAALWANSPDSQGDRADDKRGYNAGLVHFFEYRSAKEKKRRFRDIEEPMTVDGFIAFSQRLYQELVDPPQPSANQRVVLQDSEGNRRSYVLCPNSEFIVAFQRPGETRPRMTSMINFVTEAFFNKVVDECLRGDDRGRLNKLGPVVTRAA